MPTAGRSGFAAAAVRPRPGMSFRFRTTDEVNG
jgi:hypothetical protein